MRRGILPCICSRPCKILFVDQDFRIVEDLQLVKGKHCRRSAVGKSKWKEFVAKFDHKTNPKLLWRTLKSLNGTAPNPDNQAIKFGRRYFKSPRDLCEQFNRQFTAVTKHSSNKTHRKIIRDIKSTELESPPLLSTRLVTLTLKDIKGSPALGPDQLSNLHLKHIGPFATAYLTAVFNLSISKSQIPSMWKKSIIIPLPKPAKPVKSAKSYRPISLLCPASKLLEKLLADRMVEHLRPTTHQHGFRARHSTVTALNEISEDIAAGFNAKKPPKRTILVALDLSKAFDMVNHDILLSRVADTSLPGYLLRWLSTYLQGRQAQTSFRNTISSFRITRNGVPQGSMLGPLLFNFYVSDGSAPPANINIKSYADDFTVYTSTACLPSATGPLNTYLSNLADFFNSRDLHLAAEKCTSTLFTTDPKQYKINPNVKINDKPVPHSQTIKILGITFDTGLTFTPHIKDVCARSRKRLNVLKALSGTNWGQSKETLLITYKATVRPLLDYAAPVWGPTTSTTNINNLQRFQNAALRTTTGCVLMSSQEHLHQETEILEVRRHTRLLCVQQQLSRYLPAHPGHHIITRPNPPRLIKESLHTRYNRYIEPYLDETEDKDKITSKEYRKILKNMHTTEVKDAINNYEPSRVLATAAPMKIHDSEKTLPRGSRRQLAQLRSGFSPLLMTYSARINNDMSETCPDCKREPHTTQHLFKCPMKPTNLSVKSLWTRPVEAAKFLSLPLNDNTATSD